MFLVVLGHALMPYISSQPGAYLIFSSIYIFHMPAFVFISGYFSSFVSDNKKSILKLLIAYLVFNYIMMLYAGYIQGLPFQFLEPYYSYWYLIALMIWRLLGHRVMGKRWLLPLSIILAILIGFWNDIDNTFALSRIFGFFPFYIAGYQASKISLNRLLERKKDSFLNIGYGILAVYFSIFINLLLRGNSFNDLIWHPYESGMGAFNRTIIYLAATVMIMFFYKIVPKRKVRWLSDWGKNSLSILVLHRYVLFIFASTFMLVDVAQYLFLVLLIISIVTMFIVGNNKAGSLFNAFLDYLYLSIFGKQHEKKRKIAIMFLIFLVFSLSLPVITHTNIGTSTQVGRDLFKTQIEYPIHPVLSNDQLHEIDKAISIAFVGDLILLQDQVREAWSPEKKDYDFDPIFEYAKTYLQESDYAIGVLEGPLAGEEAGYSTSNYGDGIPLYLNFPDSFAKSIAKSGIDLVTVANNHLLDKDVAGAMRTLDILDQLSLDYVGAYRNQQEKDTIKIIEIKGLKVAVLAYTFPSNYYSENYFFEENNTITSILVDKNSPYFKQSLDQVKLDFEKAHQKEPDFIIVLPHMGTQFIHETDKFQDLWNDIFIQNGADIILTAHSHAVQPIEFRAIEKDDLIKTAIIVNCPGNFANSYVDYNGDATSIVKVYLDPEEKTVISAGIVPMWTHAPINSIHRALPIYDVLNDVSIGKQISSFEMNRIDEVQKLVTSVMLNIEIPLDQSQQEYFLFPDGYYRQRAPKVQSTEEAKDSDIYKFLEGNKNVRFVGDSITDGSKNGGYGWFEPLAESIEGLSYTQKAWQGATTYTLLENINKVYSHDTDIYVIAIGTNDIRYRDKKICAMTSEEYIHNIDILVNGILSEKRDTDFVFISPWPVLYPDPFSTLNPDQKDTLFKEYSKALEKYCHDKGFLFIDPHYRISEVLKKEISSHYLIDHIHPNASGGILLYSSSIVSLN